MALRGNSVKSNAGRLHGGRNPVSSDAVDETWDQIGVRLKEARGKAELSVDDVVFRARIPKSVVEALEAEDFSVFTSPTYAKSFLRQYSEFLNVDAEPWLNALEPAAYVGGDGLQPMFAESPVSHPGKRPGREGRRQENEDSSAAGSKWAPVWVMFLTAALVFGVVKGYQVFDEKFGKEGAATEKPEEKTEPDAEKAPATAETKPEESVTAPEKPVDEAVVQEVPAAQPPRAVIIRE